jgi:hypothetical protein
MPKAKRINTTPPDPIIVAIANHKKLERKWLDMAAALDGACETGRRSMAYAEARGFTRRDVELATDIATDAAWAMAETEPTTVAGAAAMLKYLTRDRQNGLFELGEVIWLDAAFRTLERSLAKMARGSRLAA